MLKIGITGGIGSGKSTLIRHFRENGTPHYDSDRRAKELMANNFQLRKKIAELLGEEAYSATTGELNRTFIAEQVFADSAKREALNNIVHPAVMNDFEAWADNQQGAPYVVLESAILFDANLEGHIDQSVAVLAPEELRIMRVVNRDGCSEEQARARIAAQMSDDELHSRATHSVVNIFEEDLEGAAKRLDQIFKQTIAQNEAARSK